MAEQTKDTAAVTDDAKAAKKEELLEVIVAVALGVTALLTAWASWIGSLHGGNQATNYAQSTNIAADGNSRWNEAAQTYQADLQTWNRIMEIVYEEAYATDPDVVEKYDGMLEQIIVDNCSDEFTEAVTWALNQTPTESPFNMPIESPYDDGEEYTFLESYFVDARYVLWESEDIMAQGQADNHNGDRYNLVTVFYSVVMFLLGIVGTFKSMRNRTIVLSVAGVCFLVATILMFTIPLPTGFSFASFFS